MTGIDTDDLYGLPLERFVPERDALARAIRAEGRREEAAAAARLPKPSVAAWVVNQLVRSRGDAVKSLLDAGDALREAQTAVIEGHGDGRSLRAAAERERAAVDELLGAARDVVKDGGPSLSNTIIDRVTDTLHAAAFDEDAREQVRGGRLARELRHVGLGGALAAGPLAPAKPQPAAKREPAATRGPAAGKAGRPGTGAAGKADKQAEAEARKAAKQAEAEARKAAKRAEAEAQEARRAAKLAEAEARRRAERAERGLARAEERQQQAAQALQEADEALAAARAESEAAAEAHREARERLSSG